jgi:hypothetical protein
MALVQIIFPHNPHTCLSICPTGTQGIYPTIEISVKRLKPGHEGLLNFTVVSNRLPPRGFFNGPKR